MRRTLSEQHPAVARGSSGARAQRRDSVIYVGGFGLPDRTASAQRCLGNARLLRSVGFEVTIVGKLSPELSAEGMRAPAIVDGFTCYDIRAPLPGRKFKTYVHSAEPIEAVIEAVGSDRVHSVIAYNYPAVGLSRLIDCCKRRGIPTVVECTEWYGWEGRDPLRNMQRIMGSFWRARVLASRAGNVIVASKYLLKHYEGKNVLVLPFVVDANEDKWARKDSEPCVASRRLVYAGSPGLGLRKDKINYLMEALATLRAEGLAFHLDVVGLTREQYIEAIPAHKGLVEGILAGSVQFHGRVPHAKAIAVQRAADYSVFFRDPDRMSHVGFPTKYVEAVACGIPCITNPTSDIPCYLTDGVNGFLARSHRRSDIAVALRRALKISDEDLAAMKVRLVDNPFHVDRWEVEARRFMQAIQRV